jgi:hypothetical protein
MSIEYKRLRTRNFTGYTHRRHTTPCDRGRKAIATWAVYKRTEMP